MGNKAKALKIIIAAAVLIGGGVIVVNYLSQSPQQRAETKINSQYDKLLVELEDVYSNYWLNGQSKPFLNFDRQPSREDTDKLYQVLKTALSAQRDIDLYQAGVSSVSSPRYIEAQKQIRELKKIGIVLK